MGNFEKREKPSIHILEDSITRRLGLRLQKAKRKLSFLTAFSKVCLLQLASKYTIIRRIF